MSDFLERIAEGMKTNARAQPRREIRPPSFKGKLPGEMPHGAHLLLMFFPLSEMFWLRVARKGLSPENDFSAEGFARVRARNNEVKTFLRAFGAGTDAQLYHGAEGLWYFADCYWADPLRLSARVGGNHEASVFQKTMVRHDIAVAAPRLLGE